MSHQKLHIRHSILMGSKGKTMLKHANQYALYSGKVLCPTVLADIGSDVLKLANLMSVIDNTLGRHESRRLMLWKHCWIKNRRRPKKNSRNN
uniref:IMPDH domain-containing protein n=1 Tax=Heterorhabditis bacteriophora TaxID=37862 RepID=A0A1I7XR18_HETBA